MLMTDQEKISQLEAKIESYKKLLRLANVPEMFIASGEISAEPTEDDIRWAKSIIAKRK
jgi:hypothetical protein